jgi:hypothetical protein
MPTARVRTLILRKLYTDFKKAGFTYRPEYEEYYGRAEDPVLFRAIKKQFNNWLRALAQLERYYPDVYKKPVKQPKPVIKTASPEVKPKAKPVFAKPKAVEKKDGKDI